MLIHVLIIFVKLLMKLKEFGMVNKDFGVIKVAGLKIVHVVQLEIYQMLLILDLNLEMMY